MRRWGFRSKVSCSRQKEYAECNIWKSDNKKTIYMIEEFELKYILHEPNLIILGDFNLPLETQTYTNKVERERARLPAEYLKSFGLTDCWKSNDDRITYKTGQTRLDRIMYRIDRNFKEQLKVDWTFTPSYHCMLQLYLLPDKQKIVTRRTVLLPTYLLDNKVNIDQIKKGMVEFELMCNEQWLANVKLENLK